MRHEFSEPVGEFSLDAVRKKPSRCCAAREMAITHVHQYGALPLIPLSALRDVNSDSPPTFGIAHEKPAAQQVRAAHHAPPYLAKAIDLMRAPFSHNFCLFVEKRAAAAQCFCFVFRFCLFI